MPASPATDDLSRTLPDAAPEISGAAPAGVLTPGFYHQNPFRQLGVPVLAGPREILRRVDELKLSAELGAVAGQWAFAPPNPLTPDEVRGAAQRLKNPRERLFHELFWFWPENYPRDGADDALACLARDNTVQAGKLWSAAAGAGHEVAWHNLAVYHHLLALEWEKDERRDEASLAGVWQQVVSYWLHVIAHEKLWERLQARVDLLADAQLGPDSVARLRAGLPETIAQINAALACEHAEHDRMARAARHGVLVGQILRGDGARIARVLEVTTRPAARRIEDRVEKARSAGAARPAMSLQVATTLVRECGRDLRVLEVLGGATAGFYVEHLRLFASAVLDEVVRYQRETGDDPGSLPLLWYLRDVATTPELAERIATAHTVIQANALTKEAGDPVSTAENRERIFRLITGIIVPGMDQLGLTDLARQAYAARVAEWLKLLATEACEKNDELDWAMQVMMTALNLPCDPGTTAALVAARDGLQQDFQLRLAKSLHLEAAGHALAINARGLAFDGQTRTAAEITGLRHGWTPALDGTPPRYVVAWRSADGEFEINETNFFTRPRSAAEEYARVLDALYHFIAPGLIERLTVSLRTGTPLLIGDLQLDGAGATLASLNGSRFWKRTVLVPHARVQHGIEGQFLKISSADNPNLGEMVDVLQTWNAAVIGYVIDRLAHE